MVRRGLTLMRRGQIRGCNGGVDAGLCGQFAYFGTASLVNFLKYGSG
jgi:hypothetical protein